MLLVVILQLTKENRKETEKSQNLYRSSLEVGILNGFRHSFKVNENLSLFSPTGTREGIRYITPPFLTSVLNGDCGRVAQSV